MKKILVKLLVMLSTTNSFSQNIKSSIQDISFTSNYFTLNGTIRIPEHKINQKLPAILIVHGSGATDRNGTYSESGFTFQSYLKIADYFYNAGFIVLNYDKRNYQLLKENKIAELDETMPETFINDARSAIDYLHNLEDVDNNKIIIIGHSESGGLIPKIIENKKIKLAICLSPQLLRTDKQIIYQLNFQIKNIESINKKGEYDQIVTQLNQFLENIKNDIKVSENNQNSTEKLKGLGCTINYFNEAKKITQNIVSDIKNVSIPILIINGTSDLKCPQSLLKEYEEELKQKNNLKIIYIENMFHEPYIYNGQTFVFCDTAMNEIDQWIKNNN